MGQISVSCEGHWWERAGPQDWASTVWLLGLLRARVRLLNEDQC